MVNTGLLIKVEQQRQLKIGERKVFTENILPTRIAEMADIKRVLGVEDVTPDMLKGNADLQKKLQEAGYDGLAIEHDVLIFRD